MRLNVEWARIAAAPDTIELMKKADIEPMSSTPDDFAKFLKSEISRWTEVIKGANLSSQ